MSSVPNILRVPGVFLFLWLPALSGSSATAFLFSGSMCPAAAAALIQLLVQLLQQLAFPAASAACIPAAPTACIPTASAACIPAASAACISSCCGSSLSSARCCFFVATVRVQLLQQLLPSCLSSSLHVQLLQQLLEQRSLLLLLGHPLAYI